MADKNLQIGNYDLRALGRVFIVSTGAGIVANAAGAEGNILLGAGASVGAFSGPAMWLLENNEPLAGKVTIQAGPEGSVKLGVGPPIAGALITMGPEELTLSVGPPGVGASIKLTPESITLKVAEVSLTLTPEGITEDVAEVSREVTPEGHNFTAAETEMNIGVAGITSESPTRQDEVEGGNVVNETLGTHSTDAVKNVDAAILMTE
jgi:hypothetical protein